MVGRGGEECNGLGRHDTTKWRCGRRGVMMDRGDVAREDGATRHDGRRRGSIRSSGEVVGEGCGATERRGMSSHREWFFLLFLL